MKNQGDSMQYYKSNPMHLRTIKLFRWHLDKQTIWTLEEMEKAVAEFQIKYDVTGNDFLHPVSLALTNQLQKTDLIPLIYSLGKDKVMERLKHFLSSN